MGYFEGLADASFKTDVRGRHLFYPWGVLGKGYILPDPETYRAMRRSFIRMYMFMLSVIIILSVIMPVLSFAFVIGYTAWYYLYVRKKSRYWPHAEEKLTVGEAAANSARGHNLIVLIILCVISLLFTLTGLALVAPKDPVMGILIGGFFGLCTLSIGHMVRIKLRARKDDKLKN